MAEDCEKTPTTNKGGEGEKAGSKQASPAPQPKSAGGTATSASPNKAAAPGSGELLLTIARCSRQHGMYEIPIVC